MYQPIKGKRTIVSIDLLHSYRVLSQQRYVDTVPTYLKLNYIKTDERPLSYYRRTVAFADTLENLSTDQCDILKIIKDNTADPEMVCHSRMREDKINALHLFLYETIGFEPIEGVRDYEY